MGHALTNQTIQAFNQSSNEGHAHLSLLCALERLLIIYCSFFSQTRVKQIPSLSFKHTVFHKQECNTTNNRFFLYIYSICPDKSEKYVYCLWFDLSDLNL